MSFKQFVFLLWIGCDLQFARNPSAAENVDFNRDIRPILSENCFLCHGPDENERKGKLRLDLREAALAGGRSGEPAIVPGKAEESTLYQRITHADPDEQMPPAKSNKKLSTEEVETLRRWIEQGADYAKHWAYSTPMRPVLPEVEQIGWAKNAIDRFVLARLEKEGLRPSPEADRRALIRRVSLDLTGLPPTPEEADQFARDHSPDAYERLVDRLLRRESFGEHWATMWLDLARYADSAGYADDPFRSIWAYRDYVINSFNTNKPFDQFTIEQIAGDLLDEPTEEQLVATAFHRNTMTNNEGGTSDEEFRNAAVVDRVNTTATVWMGTSMACAQCHTHKYDPITQEEYFQFMAFLDNTEDADRGDESPTLKFFTRKQKEVRSELQNKIDRVEATIDERAPEANESYAAWKTAFPGDAEWKGLKPTSVQYNAEPPISIQEDGLVTVEPEAGSAHYEIEIPVMLSALTALRIELPSSESDGENENFVISRIAAKLLPPNDHKVSGRYIRLELPGKEKILSLAELQVFAGDENVAGSGEASQSSTDFGGDASLAIDGNTDGAFEKKSTTHTKKSENPWWELDLKKDLPLERVVVWNRTDNSTHKRLNGVRIKVLDKNREVVWEQEVEDAPERSAEYAVDGVRPLQFAGAWADSSRAGFEAKNVLAQADSKVKGWSPASEGSHSMTLLTGKKLEIVEGAKLLVRIEESFSPGANQRLRSFRISAADHEEFPIYAGLPSEILELLATLPELAEASEDRLVHYYLRQIAPEFTSERKALEDLRKDLDAVKPNTVPVMRELAGDQRRTTRVQHRGNFMDLGVEVSPGVPSVFKGISSDGQPDRLELAKWLVSEDNPLTARVTVNRFWEQIFGVGLVRTGEEFGSQGELPSHPELLDWLATEFVAQGWNVKQFLKMLVTSASYRQSSRVSAELAERDPDNRLLARGPRFRMQAETLRDQALYVAGLLSPKMHGPSVNPPRPSSGLSAAFGKTVDWKTSEGEDAYRRALYTETRRTSPYPSAATFDAPNREVCTVRRNRTNTPLQALVTLNDPVYMEAAEGLALRMLEASASIDDGIRAGFERCLARPPSDEELRRLVALFEEAKVIFDESPDEAERFNSRPSLTPPEDRTRLAAFTAVANVLLNLDETLMKR